ncbi:class I SAM-dependent methyltransferase [Gangjinia marincola]|uniref:Class I SAM-dependent methyltransferase n=1 Tax=Gangjinia marincola TaxID=578463 RepID=A0ABN1MDT1_9FLAO
MWQRIRSYFRFLLNSTNQHGVHSPFVFQLVTKCFYDKTHYKAYDQLKKYRHVLLENNKIIFIKDYGAGSRTSSSVKRKVSALAKKVGTSSKRQQLLFRLAQYLNVHASLELGTSLGLATSALAQKKDNKITTIEGSMEVAHIAKNLFKNFGLSNIASKTGQFDQVLPSLLDRKYDLVFIDGHHQKESTLRYFEQLIPCAHNDTIFIFDDIYWSSGMEVAWKEIKQHPKVKVTIDTYHWGLVFFRAEQEKEHFTIRV